MQTDIFLYYYHKMKPGLATLFLNSTAHLQHAYWRCMEPERFIRAPDAEEVQAYHAILFGYQNMDRILADFCALEEDGVTLAIVTALSQQPFLKYDASGGQRFYRPRNLAALLELVAVRPKTIEPLMAHQYILRFGDAMEKCRAVELISRMRCEGTALFSVEANDDTSICISNARKDVVKADAKIAIGTPTIREEPFNDLFYLIEETKSGCHHPEGVAWFKIGASRHHKRKISILDIFPTILDIMGVAYPSAGVKGESLIVDWKIRMHGFRNGIYLLGDVEVPFRVQQLY